MLYDLLHGWVIDPIITCTDMNERMQLKNHVDYLCGILPNIAAKTLLLLDRGLPVAGDFRETGGGRPAFLRALPARAVEGH